MQRDTMRRVKSASEERTYGSPIVEICCDAEDRARFAKRSGIKAMSRTIEETKVVFEAIAGIRIGEVSTIVVVLRIVLGDAQD